MSQGPLVKNITEVPTATIAPTIGRVVWYFPRKNEGNCFDPAQPYSGEVVYVHGDREVNLVVNDHCGVRRAVNKVRLLQGEDVPDPDVSYATWMPYQIGQARK